VIGLLVFPRIRVRSILLLILGLLKHSVIPNILRTVWC